MLRGIARRSRSSADRRRRHPSRPGRGTDRRLVHDRPWTVGGHRRRDDRDRHLLARRGQVSRPGSESMTELDEIRRALRRLCADFPETYWVELEPNGYPQAFVKALTGAGWLAALIPEEYGGAGLPLAGRARSSKRSTRAVGTPPPATRRCTRWARSCGTGATSRRRATCRGSRAGSYVCRRSVVTEPDAGSDTTSIRTTAERVGDGYVVRGQKWKQGHKDAARTLHGPASRAHELTASPLSCFPGLSTAAAAPTRPRCSPS